MASAMAMLTFQVQGESHIIKMDKYDMGCKKLYSCIFTMCTPGTRDKIKGLKDFSALDRERKFHDLTKVIKSIMLQFESHKDLVIALALCLKHIMDCK